ncbi:HK97 gp10 family phage protein [Clostridium felsineum]|uniref:HK97-gp10 family putative phage morphogenesis protein n=1 Tax=Clostridium felsineum TaxID=36839 RepID=UPI00214D48C2|nr:HK97-gp10 family putative phage morphogenesis protein [Clostridium felsineum]MCR3760419.1 HK97 gp10 family phage protein [Clostridium felsineum]
MDIDITEGMKAVISSLSDVEKKIYNSMLNKMENGLGTIELDAKKNCSVDTGALRASITHKKQLDLHGVTGVIGSTLEYAVYVHQGTGLYAINGDGRQEVPWVYRNPLTGKFYSTKGQKPNPFLKTAIEQNRAKLDSIFSSDDKI